MAAACMTRITAIISSIAAFRGVEALCDTLNRIGRPARPSTAERNDYKRNPARQAIGWV